MAPDLILAAAEGYGWDDVRPFVESLTATGFDGEVRFFATRMDESTRARVAEAGIEVVQPRRVARHLDLLIPHDRILTRLRWPPGFRHLVRAATSLALERRLAVARLAGAVSSPEVARYFWYFDYLWGRAGSFRNVMLTDVRDVVFLGRPFDFEIEDATYCFLEAEEVQLADSFYNRTWLTTAYGERVLEKLGDRPISCSGVTIGSERAVRAYLAVMVDHLARLPRHVGGIDQGVHNFVVHSELVQPARLVPNRDGVVLTAGKMSAMEATKVLAERRSEVKVVHQYDRHPELVRAINALLRSERVGRHPSPEEQVAVPGRMADRPAVKRRRARVTLVPLVGVAAVAATAAVSEALGDRDWRLQGLEWPANFLIAALLVLLLPVVLRVMREHAPARPGGSTLV